MEKIDDSFSSKERRMYNLIWSVTVESCMSPALYNSISAKITAPVEKEYKYNSELVNFPGWKKVRGYEKENPEYWLFARGLVGCGRLHQFLSAIDLARRGSRSGQSGADPSRLRKTAARVHPMAIRQAISSQWI